jgi:hypothetical protein
MFLRLAYFASRFRKILLDDVFAENRSVIEWEKDKDDRAPIVTNCEHARFSDDIAQVGPVEAIGELSVRQVMCNQRWKTRP